MTGEQLGTAPHVWHWQLKCWMWCLAWRRENAQTQCASLNVVNEWSARSLELNEGLQMQKTFASSLQPATQKRGRLNFQIWWLIESQSQFSVRTVLHCNVVLACVFGMVCCEHWKTQMSHFQVENLAISFSR